MLTSFSNSRAHVKETVLLVAIDPLLAHDYRELFAPHYHCLTAISNAQVVQIVQKTPLHVLVFIAALPNDETLDLIRTVHRIKPETPIIVLTATTDFVPIITAFNEGCITLCLQLPTPPEALLLALRNTIRRSEIERVQKEIADHAQEIDAYIHSTPYWLHRFSTTVAQGAHAFTMLLGMILAVSLLILVVGVSLLFILYFLKTILGIDFFEHQHMCDFLPTFN